MASVKSDWSGLYNDSRDQAAKKIRWRTLKSRETGAMIAIYGYCTRPPLGPWFGYTKAMLLHTPCNHCGRINVFKTSWEHECYGKFYDGKTMPCQDAHACKGEPEMKMAPMWRDIDWIEVPHVDKP